VHWDVAVVLERRRLKGGGESIMVGLRDGRTLPLSTWGSRTRSRISLNDVVYVSVVEAKGKRGARVELRARPAVQGAAVVIENKTGRVLAMVGGFSYPLSQLNRATQSRRQPGSSFKPMTYLAALSKGLQPNTLVEDAPVTYPPIGGANRYSRDKDWWSPNNYDGGFAGTMTLRRALEMSKNVVTARLLDGGVAGSPEASLDAVCELAIEAHLYSKCERYYPFVLGAQPLRPIDLAGFYAAISNEGALPMPHVIDEIRQDGRSVYKAKDQLTFLASADRASVFQLRSILQGVVARGTAARIGSLSPYVAGKTGTSDDFNDSWFAGFSNDVTVVVWVGYDNARGKRTLGGGNAGSRVALPIFESIIRAVWAQGTPRTALVGPSREAARHLVAVPIDIHTGDPLGERGHGTFMEYFRRGPDGQIVEARHVLSYGSNYSSYSTSDYNNTFFGSGGFLPWLFGGRRDYDGSPLEGRRYPNSNWQSENDGRYLRPPRSLPDERPLQRPRRADPGGFFGGRFGH
jgi:membrane carboxypeptidase/penicillin-binding protein